MTRDLHWDGATLCRGDRVLATIDRVPGCPPIYRVRFSDGRRTEMASLERAKDAAVRLATPEAA
jgi:hypothetical protein